MSMRVAIFELVMAFGRHGARVPKRIEWDEHIAPSKYTLTTPLGPVELVNPPVRLREELDALARMRARGGEHG